MKRKIEGYLNNWRNDPEKRVLLLRGARQVGKTYSIRALGAQFEHFVEINFEAMRSVHRFFEGDLDAPALCRNLGTFTKTPITPGKTLLFFDEIQACPNALRALRFFYEQMPQLHTVATGSLLEFALAEIPSFGVGRIESLFMYPMSFIEFLWATGEEDLAQLLQSASVNAPAHEVFHNKLLDSMRTHQLVGGMPAVVEVYRKHTDILLCQSVIDSMLLSIRDDFGKYAHRIPVTKLADTFASSVYQAGGKFVYARAALDTSIDSYKTALDLLVRAGLVYKIYHSSAHGIPLAAQIDEKKFKTLPLDIGIYQRVLGLDLGEYLTRSNEKLIHEGKMAEIYAGIEMIAGFSARVLPQLFYWHREARASNAEVDYVIAKSTAIIPIEVKAGVRGSMKSMNLFLDEGRAQKGIRLSNENFSELDRISVVPLYAAGNLTISRNK